MSGQAVQHARGDSGNEVKPGLKDPLQSDQTPYEILGLTRGATGADIQKAFALGVGKGKNVQKLTLAKKLLQSPVDRTIVDLFHYLPEWADRLTPNGILRPDILDLAHRGATAHAWENQLKTRFPDPSIAHNLAVLWYWWALRDEEQRSQGQKLLSTVPVDHMWQKAIGYWAMFLANEDLWSGSVANGHEIATQVSSAVIARLNGRLQECGQRHKASGSADLADRYHELELSLTYELSTAKQIGSAGIRTERGKVVCGVLVLRHVGLLEMVRQQVDSALQRSPSSVNLLEIKRALSPYGYIDTLIKANKPQTALDAIEVEEKKAVAALASSYRTHQGGTAKPDGSNRRRAEHEFQETKDAQELLALRARALQSLAKQQSSLNKLEDALTTWERALECRPDAALKSEILADIVSNCQAGASASQHQQQEAAITNLERGVRLTDNPTLKLLLAELLTNRGIRIVMEAQKKAELGEPRRFAEIKAELKKGLDDLERAAKLGSKRAAEQMATARSVLEDFASGSLFQEAMEAAKREDWDQAIRLFRTILSTVSGAEKENVKQSLAVCLGNRAMATANRALQRPNPAILTRDALFASISRSASSRTGCGLCNTYFVESGFTLTLPAGGTASVCSACGFKLKEAIADASVPDPTVMAELRAAENDLSEAVQLDPTNQQTHKNLKDIRKVMAQIEGGAVFESERSSRTTSPSSGKTTFKFWSSLGKNVGKVFNGPLFFLLFIPFTIDGIKGSPWWLGPSLGLVWVVLSVWCVISWIKDDYQNS